MEIEDDFIEDSDKQEEEEEQKNEANDEFFLTGTKDGIRKPIVLKPAVNIYPISSLAQQLVSKMYSLEMFGQTSIGATVSGSVYDLGKHFKSLYSSFPEYIKEVTVYSNSKQYTLQKYHDKLKEKLEKYKQIKTILKEKIRNNERKLPNYNKQENSEFTENDRIKAEMKATSISLKKSIERLKALKQENDSVQAENEQIQQNIDDVLSQFRHKCVGEVGKVQKNIVKTEIELKENMKKYRESLMQAQNIVNAYNEPIHTLEVRLSDLNRRINIYTHTSKLPKLSKI